MRCRCVGFGLRTIFFEMPLLAARRRGAPSGGCKELAHHKLGALVLLVLLDLQDFVTRAKERNLRPMRVDGFGIVAIQKKDDADQPSPEQ
jgi:hypothetical protein